MTPADRDALWALAKTISGITGVVLGEKQEPFIKTRILRRMRELGIESFAEYRRFADANSSTETGILISALTTHHTYFFREIEHFDHLQETALAKLVAQLRAEKRRTLRIWSAAASYGHEAYSIAMFLDHHLKKLAPEMTFEIFGSDVSEEAIQVASDGVYKWQHLKEAPTAYTGGQWLKGTGKNDSFVKVKPALREKCDFKVVNLKTLSDESAQPKFDVIFCRNVFIYFTPDDIRAITKRLLSRLNPHGYLYLGASESLHGLDLPVQSHGHSVYTHKGVVAAKEPKTAPIRVLCVDDSPAILTLLKKAFDGDEFKVVGTASNGLEAHRFLQKETVDLVTLDIHMPEMNGIEYIRAHYGPKHPPIVIVSSVVREDADLAAVAMKAGISDYVEKPSLQNFKHKRDELRGKARAAVRARGAGASDLLGYTAPRKVVVQDSRNKLRVIYAHARDTDKIAALTKHATGVSPATVFLIEGVKEPKFDATKIGSGVSTFALPDIGEITRLQKASCHVALASLSMPTLEELLRRVPRENILLEESPTGTAMMDRVRDVAPYTSLVYESTKALEKIEVVPASQELGLQDVGQLARKGTAAPAPAPAAPRPERSETHRVRAGERLLLLSEPLSKAVAFTIVPAHADPRAALTKLRDTLRAGKLLSTRLEGKYVLAADADESSVKGAFEALGVPNVRGAKAKSPDCEVRIFLDSGRLQMADRGPVRIKVLMVEDSSTMRTILRRALAAESRLEIVAECERPSQVADAIRKYKPDVMTLDMQLPEMTGAQLLKTMPPELKIPTLVVSSLNPNESRDVLEALENGAFDFVQKPAQNDQRDVWQSLCEKLVHASAGKTRVARRAATFSTMRLDPRRPIIIGSSTGGTSAIKTMLETFPREIPPILITQHIPPHFSRAFAERLDGIFPYEVKEAEEGDVVKPNRVLIAPGGRHMEVKQAGENVVVRLTDAPPVNRHRPSCDVLFESAAQVFGRSAMGVILTGMGADGAKGLLTMRRAGSHTVGQNEESCVVYGMPKAAMALGAVVEECALETIIQRLVNAQAAKKAA